MTVADFTKSILNRFGLDLRRFRPTSPRRIALMNSSGVRTVIDVGANTGQYGTDLRQAGFQGDIVSFEPLSDAYAELLRTSRRDENWHCRQLAISDRPGSGKIYIAGNSASSSLLVMAGAHNEAAPEAAVVGAEEVTLCRLDAVDEIRSMAHPLMLKLDVQGHELAALDGAAGILDRVALVEAELSICELYAGAPLMLEVLSAMAGRGFELVALEPGFYDPRDGRFLQFDGFFRRIATATP